MRSSPPRRALSVKMAGGVVPRRSRYVPGRGIAVAVRAGRNAFTGEYQPTGGARVRSQLKLICPVLRTCAIDLPQVQMVVVKAQPEERARVGRRPILQHQFLSPLFLPEQANAKSQTSSGNLKMLLSIEFPHVQSR